MLNAMYIVGKRLPAELRETAQEAALQLLLHVLHAEVVRKNSFRTHF